MKALLSILVLIGAAAVSHASEIPAKKLCYYRIKPALNAYYESKVRVLSLDKYSVKEPNYEGADRIIRYDLTVQAPEGKEYVRIILTSRGCGIESVDSFTTKKEMHEEEQRILEQAEDVPPEL